MQAQHYIHNQRNGLSAVQSAVFVSAALQARTKPTHYTIDYSKSPAKAFDEVEDIKEYLGDRYDHMVELIENVSDCERFTFYCSMMGISGFPVKAWYEHFHGQNSYKETE